MAELTVKYNGTAISELSASGSVTLQTAGKYIENDILLEYMKRGDTVSAIRVNSLVGSSVSCSKGTITLQGTATSGVVIFGLPSAGTWTITGTSGTDTATTSVVAEENGVYDITLDYFNATINATWPAGSTCTCTKGNIVLTAPNTTGSYSFDIPSAGTWTVACTDGSESKSTNVVVENNHTYSVSLAYILMEPFGTTSNDNFVKLIRAAHNGTINLQTDAGWKVGDRRTIAVSAFTGGGSVSHAAQNIDIVISSFSNYQSCGCVMQFDFYDALATMNRMHSSKTNTVGYDGSEMYKTTLPALVNALPAYLKGLLISFSCKVSIGGNKTTIETVTGNKLALRSEIEVFGTRTYSPSGEGSQLPYYQTAANKSKHKHGTTTIVTWWERSPYYQNNSHTTNTYYYCAVNYQGTASFGAANSTLYVAPFGCI